MDRPDTFKPIHEASSLGERVSWLISLRWLAIIGVFAIVIVAAQVFHVRLRSKELFAIGGFLAVVNVVFYLTCRVFRVKEDRVGGRARVLACGGFYRQARAGGGPDTAGGARVESCRAERKHGLGEERE